jgi:hypothetical protein
MVRKVLMSALAALVLATSLVTVPVRAESGEMRPRSTALELAQVQPGRYGPYATIRRANEVANQFRRLGYNAQVIPVWGEYYVDVW